MSFSFSNSAIEELKDRVNIVDVIGRVVPLKRSGSNYKGVCPFHSEKTPSFVVSEQKQIFTCFGCGASGDMIEFVKRYYNLDFTEAVEKIAGEYGIVLEKRQSDGRREKYYEVNRLAARFFYRAFTEKANPGYSYMKKRGITPAVLKKFGIGYADSEWTSLVDYMNSQGIENRTLIELGLAAESRGRVYDKFRNRVMFPIINTSGKVIGFGGRAVSDQDNPKYLNSPESLVFRKKNNLYGLNISRQNVGKDGFIILVEGYMDVIALYQGGVHNVAASLGTALTENQAALIKRYTDSAVLSYDADSAGRNAALRGMDILKKENLKVRVLHVTDGKDPDEFIKKNGKEAFLKLVEEALPYGDYKLEAAKSGIDMSSGEGRIDYIRRAAGIIASMSPVERDIYIAKAAKEAGVSESAVRMEIMPEGETISSGDMHSHRLRRSEDDSDTETSHVIAGRDRDLLTLSVRSEKYIDTISTMPDIFALDVSRKIFDVIENDFRENGNLDINRVLDTLPDEERELLTEACESTPYYEDEEKVLADCMKDWKLSSLADEEERILTMLSLADETGNDDKLSSLMERLKNIQLEIQAERNLG